MTLNQSIFINFTLALVCTVLVYFLLSSNQGGTKTLKFDLKDAVVEIGIEGDVIDTEKLLQRLVTEQNYSTTGILNGNGYYSISDAGLITALENAPTGNQVVTKLRMSASDYSSIFSNNLSTIPIKLAPQFSPNSGEIGACNKSEYFDKQVLLSNLEETKFIITKVKNSGACSDNINQLYVNNELIMFLSGCNNAESAFTAKVQLFEDEIVSNSKAGLCPTI